MKTLVLYTSGTLGDHLPFVALGQVLQANGFRVRLAINQAMHDYARRAGLEVIALSDIERGPEQARANAWAWNHWRPPEDRARHPNAHPFDVDRYVTQARELIDLCRQADLLISTSIRTLGLVAHAALGIPWLTVSVNPFAFWQPAVEEEQAILERRQLQIYATYQDLISHTFDELGIDQPVPPWSKGWSFARHVILASSRHFSRPDLDQLQPRSSIDQTGFWFYQDPAWETWQPDQALLTFCQRRPIALAFSSQPLEDPRRALAVHAVAAARLERPLLVQRGWAGFTEEDLPPDVDPQDVLFTGFIPHDWLFARAACAIQHGGIGSIARALRQGCPLLIEPYGNDQLYNASRVVDLGVGAAAHPFESTGDDLARILEQQVLTPACRRRAEAIGEGIRAENGLEDVCQLIETCITRAAAPDQPPARPLSQEAEKQAVPTHVFPLQAVREGRTSIPPILHQTWRDANLPSNLAAFQRTWATHHPDWTLYLWTDADNREFLAQFYPWFLPIYDSYDEPIKRVDAVRYFILYHFGGVYADLDFECLRPLGPLLDGKQVVLGLEPSSHLDVHFPRKRSLEQIVGNAFMASIPRHPFWKHVFRQLVAYHQLPDPLDATGPFLLTRAIHCYPHRETITVEPADRLYPIDKEGSEAGILRDPAVRERLARSAYAVHHWHATWWQNSVVQRTRRAGLTVLSQGEPISTTMLLDLEEQRLQLLRADAPPRVSCLMVTAGRPALARRAIHCFRRQHYPNRELVILDAGRGDTLETWVAQLADPQIVYLRATEGSAEGLWHMALEAASGPYVARWSDGDLSDPRRLEVQIAAMCALQVDACLLERQQIWWPRSSRLASSYASIWPDAFVCARASLLPSPTDDGEAAPRTIFQVVANGQIALVDFPQLYVYVLDETDTLAAADWETLWHTATERYDGALYHIVIQKLENWLDLDLGPWIEPPAARDRPRPSLFTGQKEPQVAGRAIPRILHQTWKDEQLPSDLARYRQTWIDHHPGWTVRLWTDVDNRQFLRRHYPWFLPIYDHYDAPIKRVDAVRTFILYHFGGVYADLDFEALRPLDPLLDGKQVVLGLEPEAHLALHQARRRGMDQIVSNALMASVPGHPFWEHVFQQLIAYHRAANPLDATGPFLLTRAYDSFPHQETVSLAPAELLFPISSQTAWSDLPAEERTRITQTAYAVHHWRGSWWQDPATVEAQQARVVLIQRGQGLGLSTVSLQAGRAWLDQEPEPPCVSCLMVTQDRFPLARRAVECFRRQTYPHRELVIVDDGEEDALEEWIESLEDEQIVYRRLPAEGQPLGALRNLAVRSATGAYVAQWDDDDLSAPRRLEIQMAVIHTLRLDACFLEREMIWWPGKRRLAVSCRRVWESSFVCAKAKLPPYPPRRQGEDTPVAERLATEERVGLLDLPQLYVYVYHGDNTFAAAHWENHWLTANESYEGGTYDVKLEELGHKLGLDLSGWHDGPDGAPPPPATTGSRGPQEDQGPPPATGQLEETAGFAQPPSNFW